MFQKCRTIINREKAEEREKLRKSKRLRKSPTKKVGYASSFVLPTEWDNDTASTPSVAYSNDVELIGGTPYASAISRALNDDSSLDGHITPSGNGTRFEADFDAPWEEATRIHPASPVRTTRRGQRNPIFRRR